MKSPVLSSPVPSGHTEERASFWRVTPRTIRRYLAANPPVPVDDVDAMVAWYCSLPSAKQTKLAPTFRARITEFRMHRQGAPAAPGSPTAASDGTHAAPRSAPPADPYWSAFQRERTSRGTTAPASAEDSLTRTRLLRDYAQFKLEAAQSANDLAAASDAAALFKLNSDIIHDEELRAQKLGREIGDIIPRADYERQLRALAYWLVRTVDDAKAALAPRLAAASATGPLFRQEVDAILEPVLLTTRVLDPLRRSADLPPGTGAALPPWALNALRTALASCLEEANPEQASSASASNGFASDSGIGVRVTEALSAPPPQASAATSVSGRDIPKPAGEAIASHSHAGSVPAQTA
ncbi:MAG: hypothetical protein V4773_13545 [Verrucomicrobiota bacterium]